MPSFRFRIPFFSSGSSSRLTSRPASSPPPPPFLPAGIAQPSRQETNSKKPPSLSRSKSNAAAISASSSLSYSPSSSADTPNRRVKQSNPSGSPLKKMESLRTEDHKVTMKEKSTGETSRENINAVIDKSPLTRPRQHLERKGADTVQEQRKKTEVEKLASQEMRKVLPQVSGDKSEANQEQQKHKLAIQETTKTQNRTDNQTNDNNHQKNKGASTSNNGNKRDPNREVSSSMSRRIKEDIKDGISKLTWGKSNNDEKSVSVITLTGENRGATMSIASEKDKKHDEVHIHRGYKTNPDESPNTTATETEGARKQPSNGQNPKDNDVETTFRAYVNGNAQGINNSIVLESSVSENDPGVHMSLRFEESKKNILSPEKESTAEKKPEMVTEKKKNEPRVRRRCLRGLLAESTESEPDNPLKPQRHGCRFTCKDKDIENI